jgi:hypothetical protein
VRTKKKNCEYCCVESGKNQIKTNKLGIFISDMIKVFVFSIEKFRKIISKQAKNNSNNYKKYLKKNPATRVSSVINSICCFGPSSFASELLYVIINAIARSAE